MIKIINGDCQEQLKLFPDNTIDLAITSPPYKDSDGYTESLIENVCTELYRILTPNSLFFLNFGHLVEDKFRPFRVCQIAMECGFELNDTITWRKNHYKPIQGSKRLNNLSEFIFILYKGKMPKLNRLAIGIPYTDISNAKRFANGRNLKCRGNVWDIKYQTINSKSEKSHNDRFPDKLPELCIKLCDYPIVTILDPFVGSGTTCKVAERLGFDSIGIEQNKSVLKI